MGVRLAPLPPNFMAASSNGKGSRLLSVEWQFEPASGSQIGRIAQMDSEHLSTKQEAASSSLATSTNSLPYEEPDWSRIIQVAKGYRAAYCPSHPNAWPNGYVYAHRLVLEKKLGRLLAGSEIAHHDNEIKSDNSENNVVLTTRSKHTTLHKSTGRTMVDCVCDNCGNGFKRAKRGEKLFKFCSYGCNGTAQRRKQIERGMANLRRRGLWLPAPTIS